MKIHLLDMGRTKYGDCLVITQGTKKILIDGAHPGDRISVKAQLKKIFGTNAPFHFDLLVVTHCHSDHIGCLPALVSAGDLVCDVALVADEKLGWGRDANGGSPTDAKDLSPNQRMLVAALQEEDHSDLKDDDLQRFLADAASLEDKYIEMLGKLSNQGTEVVRYGRDPDSKVQEIEQAFQDFGLKVLGPSQDHLLNCAFAIAQATDTIADAITELPEEDSSIDPLQMYRQLSRRFVADSGFAADQGGVGAAKNNQSIVLKVEADGWRALLAGDMQFAKAEVTGLTQLMKDLRQTTVGAGPYDFIKLTHHTSYNALNASVLADWSATKLFAHTGGSNDRSHPDEDALELLRSHQNELQFARTDRNGLITIGRPDGSVQLTTSKGQLNDFSVNVPEDTPASAEEPPNIAETKPPVPGSGKATVERVSTDDFVEVIARIPHQSTKVTLTIEVEPGEAQKKKN